VHEDPTFRFKYGDGGENVFYTDGRMTEDLEAGLLEARASWKKGKRIEIERDSPQGGAITEKYELSDDGSQLFVKTKIEGNGRMPKISFQRVYDRIPNFLEESESEGLSERLTLPHRNQSQPLRWHHIVPLALAWTTTGLWAESLQFYQRSTQARHRS